MVSIIKCTVIGTGAIYEYVCKSTDDKPTSTNGSKLTEMDTGKEYFFDGDEHGWSEQADKYLDSIAIETAPTKTTYYAGDKFDATGMTVKATYTDESFATVEFDVEAPEKLAIGSEVKAKYVENGRTRFAPVEIEIKSNEATDAESFLDILANGSEVVLENDIEISQKVEITNDFILDLNGNSVVSNATCPSTKKSDYAFTANGCMLTLKGGSIETTKAKMRVAEAKNGGTIVIESGDYASDKDLGFDAIGEGSKVIFNGGEIHAVEGGIMSFDGASIELNDGKIFVSDNFPIGTNGSEGRGNNTIIMNGGYYEGQITSPTYEAIGVYIANNDTFIMNDGEIKAINGAGILMRGGTVELNGGKITATGVAGGGGYIGDKQTVMSQSAIIYDEKSNYPGKAGMNLTVNGGTFVGFDKSIDVQSTEAEPQVTVNGGAFVPPYIPEDVA